MRTISAASRGALQVLVAISAAWDAVVRSSFAMLRRGRSCLVSLRDGFARLVVRALDAVRRGGFWLKEFARRWSWPAIDSLLQCGAVWGASVTWQLPWLFVVVTLVGGAFATTLERQCHAIPRDCGPTGWYRTPTVGLRLLAVGLMVAVGIVDAYNDQIHLFSSYIQALPSLILSLAARVGFETWFEAREFRHRHGVGHEEIVHPKPMNWWRVGSSMLALMAATAFMIARPFSPNDEHSAPSKPPSPPVVVVVPPEVQRPEPRQVPERIIVNGPLASATDMVSGLRSSSDWREAKVTASELRASDVLARARGLGGYGAGITYYRDCDRDAAGAMVDHLKAIYGIDALLQQCSRHDTSQIDILLPATRKK